MSEQREQEIAIMEGEINAAEDAYFTARPAADNGHNRHIFREGFKRAWDLKSQPTADDQPNPTRTGVGNWCAPGPVEKQMRRWLLRFEDQDRGEAVYDNEQEARAAFARAEACGWNCHLFEHAPRDPVAADDQARRDAAVTALRNTGAKLASIAFNLAQMEGGRITADHAATLDSCRTAWDLAVRELQAASAAEPMAWRSMDSAPKDSKADLIVEDVSGNRVLAHYQPGGHCIEDHPPIDEGWYYWTGFQYSRVQKPHRWRLSTPARPAVTDHMVERALGAKGAYWRYFSPEAKKIMKREMRAALEAALGGGDGS